MNYELNELIENADIERCIKTRRIAWLGHVMRMDDKRTPKRILERKLIGTRIRGKVRTRGIKNIEEDMKIVGIKPMQRKSRMEKITKKAKAHNGM
jgi:hypothetical protein